MLGPSYSSAGLCTTITQLRSSRMAKSGMDRNYIRKQASPTTELHVSCWELRVLRLTPSPELELELQPGDPWLQLLKLARALHTGSWRRILHCLLWVEGRYERNHQRGPASVTEAGEEAAVCHLCVHKVKISRGEYNV